MDVDENPRLDEADALPETLLSTACDVANRARLGSRRYLVASGQYEQQPKPQYQEDAGVGSYRDPSASAFVLIRQTPVPSRRTKTKPSRSYLPLSPTGLAAGLGLEVALLGRGPGFAPLFGSPAPTFDRAQRYERG